MTGGQRRPLIQPKSVRYIKLGGKGSWEKECLEKGIARIGFTTARPERFHLCQSGQWDEVYEALLEQGEAKGTATRFTNEIRLFFEDDGTTLWITFMAGCLQWGMLDSDPAEQHPDGDGVFRRIRGGWLSTDRDGNLLAKDGLSGALTKLAAYRGTSCSVDVAEYVVRRINAQKMPAVERALAASRELSAAIVDLMRMLTPQDFELLVDLVFTTSGWRRIGVVGKTQDTVDLELLLPSTGERAFVQVKSSTNAAQLAEYVAKLREREDIFDRMFYVYHSGQPGEADHSRVTMIGPDQLATRVLDAGLAAWLIEKVS